MPDEQDQCVQCDHIRRHHNDAGCRVTLCSCSAFGEEEAAAAPPSNGPRRVCVDVPDGYTLSISLIPVGAFEELADG